MSRNPKYPATPDGRYFVVRGRLWRTSDPALPHSREQQLVRDLMAARRRIRNAKSDDQRKAARADANDAKLALGERGPVWWTDGTPDYNRHLAKNTPYADWFGAIRDNAETE
jgi:hypothetical protein